MTTSDGCDTGDTGGPGDHTGGPIMGPGGPQPRAGGSHHGQGGLHRAQPRQAGKQTLERGLGPGYNKMRHE